MAEGRKRANMKSNGIDSSVIHVDIHKKFFRMPTPWIGIGDDRIIFTKSKFKSLMKTSFIAGNIVTGSLVYLANAGLNAMRLEQGANYIVERFSNDGLVPNGLSSSVVDGNLQMQYIDSNGEMQIVSGESIDYLVEEMTETTIANGWEVSALAVYLNKVCGDNAPVVPNVDDRSIDNAKRDAYELKKFEEKKEEYASRGVSR